MHLHYLYCGQIQNKVKRGKGNKYTSGLFKKGNATEPDLRTTLWTTLYWNPAVITTPEQNKIDLPFFNNDFTDEFRVVIEGMAADGRLTHIEKIIK